MYKFCDVCWGKLAVDTRLLSDLAPIVKNTEMAGLYSQFDEHSLLCWAHYVLTDEFEEEFGTAHDMQEREKLVIFGLNARQSKIEDKDRFCDLFNAEDLSLRVGFEGAFYPEGIGSWYEVGEFQIIAGV